MFNKTFKITLLLRNSMLTHNQRKEYTIKDSNIFIAISQAKILAKECKWDVVGVVSAVEV